MLVFSWITMLLHSLKLGFFLMAYLVDRFGVSYSDFLLYISELRMAPGLGGIFRDELAQFHAKIDRILAGEGRGNVMPGFGEIYWEVEEASFLRISCRLDQFFTEFRDVIADYLDRNNISYDQSELAEAVRYQQVRIPSHEGSERTTWDFAHSFPEYFAARFGTAPVPLREARQALTVEQKDFAGNQAQYAREVIIWGRKSGLMLTKASLQAPPCGCGKPRRTAVTACYPGASVAANP
jgi:putative methyltransferase